MADIVATMCGAAAAVQPYIMARIKIKPVNGLKASARRC